MFKTHACLKTFIKKRNENAENSSNIAFPRQQRYNLPTPTV